MTSPRVDDRADQTGDSFATKLGALVDRLLDRMDEDDAYRFRLGSLNLSVSERALRFIQRRGRRAFVWATDEGRAFRSLHASTAPPALQDTDFVALAADGALTLYLATELSALPTLFLCRSLGGIRVVFNDSAPRLFGTP